jgi:hypothetical protein
VSSPRDWGQSWGVMSVFRLISDWRAHATTRSLWLPGNRSSSARPAAGRTVTLQAAEMTIAIDFGGEETRAATRAFTM